MEEGAFKTCRFCQEQIRSSAVKCRFCGEYVETPPAPADDSLIEIEGRLVFSAEPEDEAEESETFRTRWAELWRLVSRQLVRFSLFLLSLGIAALAVFLFVPEVFRLVTLRPIAKVTVPYVIRVLPGETEIEFRGEMRAGAARELARLLGEKPRVRVIRLTSQGGAMEEAAEMARLISGHELAVSVPEECLSAAVYPFLSGSHRSVVKGARIGFQRVNFLGITAERRQEYERMALEIFREAGVDKEFARRALMTPDLETWYPSLEEMKAAGVLCQAREGGSLAGSGDNSQARSSE